MTKQMDYAKRIKALESKVARLEAKLQRVCPHPFDQLVLDETGGLRFEAGDVIDTRLAVMVCTQCGKMLTVEEERNATRRDSTA